jgi:hypothetical protein
LEPIVFDLLIDHRVAGDQELHPLLGEEVYVSTKVVEYLQDLQRALKLLLLFKVLIIIMIQEIFTDYLELLLNQCLNQLIDGGYRNLVKCLTLRPLTFLGEFHHAVPAALLNVILLVFDAKMDSQGVSLAPL